MQLVAFENLFLQLLQLQPLSFITHNQTLPACNDEYDWTVWLCLYLHTPLSDHILHPSLMFWKVTVLEVVVLVVLMVVLDDVLVNVAVVEDDVKLVLVSVTEVVVLVEVELAVEVEDVVVKLVIVLTRIHSDSIESDTEWQHRLCRHCWKVRLVRSRFIRLVP